LKFVQFLVLAVSGRERPVEKPTTADQRRSTQINADESLSFGKVDWHQVVSRQRLGAGFNSSLKICGHLRPSAV
jgi:hypothetical protein